MRNVGDLSGALHEQYRVLKPGGSLAALDTTPPAGTPLAPLIRFYLHTIIPGLGRLLARQKEAYTYLPDSIENFLSPEQMVERLEAARFQRIGYQRRMFSTIAIYWGIKPPQDSWR